MPSGSKVCSYHPLDSDLVGACRPRRGACLCHRNLVLVHSPPLPCCGTIFEPRKSGIMKIAPPFPPAAARGCKHIWDPGEDGPPSSVLKTLINLVGRAAWAS